MKLLGKLLFFILFCTGQVLAQEMKYGYYPEGQLRYKGYFVDGQPSGELIRYYPEGAVKAKMDYRGDSVHVILYNRKGDYRITGKYVHKKKVGTWLFYQENQLIAQDEYRDNQLHGKSMRYSIDGKIIEEKHWKNGKLHGAWKLFFPDGQLKLQANYREGHLEGETVSYFPEGKLRAKGNYKDNLKEGEWEFYVVTGELLKKQIYRQGILEDAAEQELEESRQLDLLIHAGKKIPDPAMFTEDPEAYMKLTGIE